MTLSSFRFRPRGPVDPVYRRIGRRKDGKHQEGHPVPGARGRLKAQVLARVGKKGAALWVRWSGLGLHWATGSVWSGDRRRSRKLLLRIDGCSILNNGCFELWLHIAQPSVFYYLRRPSTNCSAMRLGNLIKNSLVNQAK